MDDDKVLTALQHIVTALHNVAVSSPSGNPHVVQMVNAAQEILTELNPPPKPAPPADDADPINQMKITARGPDKPAKDDEDEDDKTAKRGPGRPRIVTRHK